ncbi:MarR family winged helix-turn-helix transcriptional regulator [Flexithrix dorotheae]|uniref:MarR family winged helix-turn-helix transcriptional regulator n=1 Tax=Flexithrix dorotheae TaxID=70993 RepID=UPI00036E15D1|nr:MarR family transcriptional regulator [Flexithrix dorotheae]
MEIDKELHEVLYFRIERTMRRLKEYTRQVLKENKYGITIDQWIILKRISEDDNGISQTDVSNSTFKDPAAITRIIDHLCKKQLVERLPVENDRRAHRLVLTPLGKDLVIEMTPLIQAIRAKGIKDLKEDEVEALKINLDKIYHSLDK